MKFNDALSLRTGFSPQNTMEDIVELYNGVINSPEGDVVEVGSASGGSTIMLIAAAEEVGKMVYSVDPYPEELEGNATHYTSGIMRTFRENFKRNILNGKYKNIIQYNENIIFCIDKIPNKLSVVFIDGCHELSHVQTEVDLLLPKLAVGGRLYIHDIKLELGQISKTKETGLCQINDWIKTKNITVVQTTPTIMCCKK